MFELDEEDVYPTDATLIEIEYFDLLKHGAKKLLDDIKPIWSYSDTHFRVIETEKYYRYYLDTVGWSGNENIINALQKNILFWHCCWYSSTRGGHHVFEIRKVKK